MPTSTSPKKERPPLSLTQVIFSGVVHSEPFHNRFFLFHSSGLTRSPHYVRHVRYLYKACNCGNGFGTRPLWSRAKHHFAASQRQERDENPMIRPWCKRFAMFEVDERVKKRKKTPFFRFPKFTLAYQK